LFFFFKVEQAGDRLVNKAAQLISNQTTNLTECFMLLEPKWTVEKKSTEYNLDTGAWQLAHLSHWVSYGL